jgi:hypothetical protein
VKVKNAGKKNMKSETTFNCLNLLFCYHYKHLIRFLLSFTLSDQKEAVKGSQGRVIAQAVSRRLPTRGDRVQTRV